MSRVSRYLSIAVSITVSLSFQSQFSEYNYLYHGAWVDQRVLSWYNYTTTLWLVVYVYTMAGSYTMVARGVNAR